MLTVVLWIWAAAGVVMLTVGIVLLLLVAIFVLGYSFRDRW